LGAPATTPSALRDSNLYDATANILANTAADNYEDELEDFKAAKGWLIELKESTGWIGEKSLAKTVVFGGILYVTTYTPPQAGATCGTPAEGTGKYFALKLWNATGYLESGQRTKPAGGGIPSELVVVIREGGNSGLIGSSGGAARVKVEETPPKRTFWYQE
jgi:type IV pilus assembly protein PilY1